MSLPFTHLQGQSFGNLLEILIDKTCCLAENLPTQGVESVTAENASIEVNNTDPLNPVVGLPYLEYWALLSQAGTDAPVATVLLNTLGVVGYAYVNDGTYQATSAALFTVGKTFIELSAGTNTITVNNVFQYTHTDASTIDLAFLVNSVLLNERMTVASIKITVFP